MSYNLNKMASLRGHLFQERRRLLLASNHRPRYGATPQQTHRLISTSSSLSSRLEDLTKDGFWLIPRKGTGFDNFFPKDKKEETENAKEEDGNSPESKEAREKNTDEPLGKKSGGFDYFKSSGNNNNSSGSNNNNSNNIPPNFSSTMLTGILMLAFTYMMMRTDDERSPADFAAPEISWNNLCHHLLENGQVEKIVVTNNHTMAKVYLKPGSPGLPQTQARSFRRRQQGAGSMDTTATSEMNMSNDDFSATSQDFGTSVKGGPTDHQIVYRFAIGSIDAFEKKLEEAQRVVGMEGMQEIPVQYTAESTLTTEIFSVIPSLLLMGAAFYFMRFAAGSMMGGANQGGGGGMGGIFKVGKSNAKKISKEDVKIDFSNVAGCDEAKKEIMEFVDFLQEPTQFTKLGAKIPKGALLCGPPGTGKTLLARAVAGEAGVPFFSISGSDFIGKICKT